MSHSSQRTPDNDHDFSRNTIGFTALLQQHVRNGTTVTKRSATGPIIGQHATVMADLCLILERYSRPGHSPDMELFTDADRLWTADLASAIDAVCHCHGMGSPMKFHCDNLAVVGAGPVHVMIIHIPGVDNLTSCPDFTPTGTRRGPTPAGTRQFKTFCKEQHLPASELYGTDH